MFTFINQLFNFHYLATWWLYIIQGKNINNNNYIKKVREYIVITFNIYVVYLLSLKYN